MPVNADSSIVADSTSYPSSPPPTTTPAPKRPLRTYGRPKVTPVYDSDTSFNAATSSASRDSVYRTGPPDVDEEIPPSSDPSRIPSDIELGDDDDDENNLQGAPPKFEWGWKKKMRDLDNEEDMSVENSVISGHVDASKLREPSQHNALSLQRGIESTSHPISTPLVHHDSNALAENVFGDSLLTLTTSSLSSIPINKSPSLSPEVAPARKRPSKHIIQDSDSDSENVVTKSSPANASPAFPHPIGSPTNSSPTPPTSDDDMPIRPAENMSKGTRKISAAKTRPDVEPLRFSEEPLTIAKRTKNKKSKIKPPTKKEIVETARDRLRIAADQQVSIPRAEVSKYTIQNLFASLAADKKPLSQQASIRTESSDPIEVFSSPHANSILDVSHASSASTGTLLGSDGSPFPPSGEPRQPAQLKPMTSLRDFDLDSEDLPEVGQLITKENKKQEQERQRQELLEKKQRILAMQHANSLLIDDDDLEIVPTRLSEAIIRKEEAERKLGIKKLSEGRKRQLNFGGIGSTTQKVKETPAKARRSVFFRSGAKESRSKRDDRRMSQAELNKSLAMQVMEASKQLSEEKQEEWKRRGGRMIDDTVLLPISVTDAQQAYAKKGLSIEEGGSIYVDHGEEEDQSDEDWSPDMRGSVSPSPQPEGDEADNEDQEPAEEADITMVNDVNADDMEEEKGNIKTRLPRRSFVVDSDSDTEINDENAPPPQKTTYVFGLPNRSLSMQDGNDGDSPLPALSSVRHRGSLSSLDEPTEDENDKENNTALMFDRSDDKENKAVVQHSNISAKLPLGRRKGPLFELEDEVARALSMSPRIEAHGIDADDEADKNEDTRKPLKDLLDDDDPFLSRSNALKATPSFTDRLAQSSPAATLPAIVPPAGSLSKRGFSQFSDDDLSTFGGAPLQPGFSDLFESGTEKQRATPFKRPLGLSGSFSDDPEPTENVFRNLGPSLELTQDVILQPAFQIGGNLLRKANQIFEKEQGYLIEAAAKKPQKKEPELYVNDHGFLTQTRPDVSSPEVYIPPSPSQRYDSTLTRQAEPQSMQRRPLRTLSLSGSTSFDSPPGVPLRRLQKGKSPRSPMESYNQTSLGNISARKLKLNAFDVLQGAAKSKAERSKRLLERSEFVEAEAQESDDDEMFGFGHQKVDDGEEEDGEDLDKNLEALVDDREMDEDIVAEELVREKHKEHIDLDDQVLQKIHEDAIHGEYRKKRRNHGVGINDSDEDTDDDEKDRRIRKGMYKKQKVDRDDIKALAGSEETQAFYKVYEHGIMDNDENEFGYLQESQDVVMADQETEMKQEDHDPLESISRAEVERLVRERAQQQIEEDPADNFSPHDVSWIDGDESDGNTRVKAATLKKQPGVRRRDLSHGDFDAGFEPASKSELMTDGTKDRLTKWAKVEGRSRNAGTTGRSVGGAAVTGHTTRAKTGGGSLRNSAAGSSSSTLASKNLHQKPVKTKASFLKGVVADKSALFDHR